MKYLHSFLVLMAFSSYAQIGAYKKIMEERSLKTLEAFYAELKAFQKENVEFSNAYFQLGEVELGLFANLDPIVYRVASRQYIYNASIKYSLAKNYLDIDEAIKNPSWFNFEKIKNKDSLRQLIQNEVDEKSTNTGRYLEEYEVLVRNYDKAVSNYLEARQSFIEITNSYNSLRELFLKADDDLKVKVNFVGTKFDSCMYHLDLYREVYQNMPHIHKRKVEIVLDDIEQFRMNGISPSNFLDDPINLWNYGKWAENFSDLLANEVDGLRKEIDDAFSSFASIDERMMKGDECFQINVDDLKVQRIINLISKYDSESILIDIFSYVREKVKYGNALVYERNCNSLSEIVSDELLSRRARNFESIFKQFSKADSSVNTVISSLRNQNNFAWFYEKYMPGEAGSKAFATQQAEESRQNFKNEVMQLNLLSSIEYLPDSAKKVFKVEDSLLLDDPIGDSDASFELMFNKQLSDSLMILYGKYNDQFACMGIAPDRGDYRILWKEDLPVAPNFYKSISDTSFVVVGGTKPMMTHLYASGLKKVSFNTSDDLPLDVLYNELRGDYAVIAPAENDSTIKYQKFNVTGKMSENEALSSRGRFLSHFTNEQNIWIMGMTDEMEGTAINASVYDSDYALIETYTYQSNLDLSNPKIIKNDNETFTVVSNTSEEDQLVYLLLDYEGNIKSTYTF